jgi:uncharacterized cupin superfamily protein
MKKIDPAAAPKGQGTRYPAPYDEPVKRRHWLKLGDAAGLTQFGVNLVTLDPGVWSSQRHWHELEDEFVFIVEGELTLVTDAGEEILRPGDSAGFKAGVHDGHHLINKSNAPARFLVVGGRNDEDWGEYPDIDMRFNRGEPAFTRKNGEPF